MLGDGLVIRYVKDPDGNKGYAVYKDDTQLSDVYSTLVEVQEWLYTYMSK